MRDPVRYLTRQIKAGKFRARRVGRHWMMTAADVEHNLERLANSTAAQPDSAPEAESTAIVPSHTTGQSVGLSTDAVLT